MLAVLAVALAAGAGASAAAAEAPFFKVEGVRLEPEQSRELNFKDSTAYKFAIAGTGVTASCTQMSSVAGAKIVGATVDATLIFSECSATGFGEGCKVEFKTTPLVGTLVYSRETGRGPIDVLFRTVSGSIIMKMKFVAKCNTGGELLVEGTALAAEALDSKNEAIYVGEEPPEAKIGHLRFPSTRISQVWEAEKVGEEERLKEVKISQMITFASYFSIQGASEWSLVKEYVWGIYT